MGARPIDRHTDTRHTLRHLLLQGLLIMGATGIVTASLSSWAASNVPATLVNYTCYNAAPAPLTLTDYTQCYSIWQARDGGLHYNYCLNVVGGSMNVFVNNYSTGQFAAYGFVCTHPMGGGGFAIANYSCPDGTPHQEGMCVPQESYTITLTGNTQTEPSQPLAFIATVIDKATQQPPTKAVEVKISLTVEDTSGGHDHGDSTRPRGSIGNTKCTTDDTCITLTAAAGSGTASFTFNPTDASGIHTITATCDKCNGGDNTKTVEVKVEGLEPILGSVYYALTEDGTSDVIGATVSHSYNHYLTTDAAFKLWKIAAEFTNHQIRQGVATPTVLHLNDASLKWGGRFDIYGGWSAPHSEHTRGTEIDVRANWNGVGAIPFEYFEDFKKLAGEQKAKFILECTKDKKATKKENRHNRVEPSCISQRDKSQDDFRHFHLRLK